MVLLLCNIDFSNLAHTLAESLKSVGVNAVAVATKPHKFYKTNCAKICNDAQILKLANNAKVIIWMHSQPVLSDQLKNLRNKTKIVFHGGTPYRKSPTKINRTFSFVDKSIIQTGDLLGLGAVNEQWLLPPVDTKLIQPIYNAIGDKKIIAHFPSKTFTKGSKEINLIMNEFLHNNLTINKFDYKYSPKAIAWNKNIQRMSNCDIYIDAFCPRLEKKQYGEWGIQALEAAALGKVVITHFGMWRRYRKEYGNCELQYINTQKELKQKLQKLIEMDNEELQTLKVKTRNWVEKYHSLEAVGLRFKKIIGSVLIDVRNIIPKKKRNKKQKTNHMPSQFVMRPNSSTSPPLIRPPKKRHNKQQRAC